MLNLSCKFGFVSSHIHNIPNSVFLKLIEDVM